MAIGTNPLVESEEDRARRRTELIQALVALAEVAPRLGTMLRSVQNPSTTAIGDWTIAEVAAHLSHVAIGETMIAETIGGPALEALPIGNDIPATAAGFNSSSLEADPERDLPVLAATIEESVARFIEVMAGANGSEPVTWLGGVTLPSSTLATHLLEELLVHGYDVGVAASIDWPITRSHAALACTFLFDLMRFAGPETRRAFVRQENAAGLDVCFEFRFRGGRTQYLAFRDGSITVSPDATKVDCRVSVDPIVAMLMAMNRIGLLKPALTGRAIAWGRKPWLALRFGSLLRNP